MPDVDVFPTPVGVFLYARSSLFFTGRLPHARGGVSNGFCPWYSDGESSPRPWGCFWTGQPEHNALLVFPTPVGVFLIKSSVRRKRPCLPHARGGVSVLEGKAYDIRASSPRPWGCFSSGRMVPLESSVFPTPVGVFLFPDMAQGALARLPHARGGVSGLPCPDLPMNGSSPRPWGCFLLMVVSLRRKNSLPHARGGVSGYDTPDMIRRMSSPRPWGCFPRGPSGPHRSAVFPTPVGVFPVQPAGDVFLSRLPHARGGVSSTIFGQDRLLKSSPRPWGCFLCSPDPLESELVFPTPVGVFLIPGTPPANVSSLPHARGGVSA